MSKYFKSIHTVFFITTMFLTIAAVLLDAPTALLDGYIAILRSPDLLASDYVYIGGLGAALLNSAITSLLALGMLILFKHEAKSATISNLWLVMGFAFFGKNPLNVLPIFFGGWLYSRFMKQNFNVNILTCLVAASLAPAVTQMTFIGPGVSLAGIALAIGMGVLIGFIFDPIAKNIFKVHDGFNLYNGGFAAGMLAISISAILSSYNLAFTMNDQWSSGNNLVISAIIIFISLWLIFVGLYMHGDVRDAFTRTLSMRKQHNDYYPVYGYICYVNMGLLGIFCTAAALILGLEISGLALGAILSVMGFGANGKQIYSTSSLMAGIVLGTLLSPLSIYDPGITVAFFFVACLSPLPAKFGWHWGVIAGILHLHLVTTLAVPSGGINLYNNGIAAGFVVIILLPIIRSIQQRREAAAAAK